MSVQAYKFSSNEYRLFPMGFSFNYCDSLAKDEFGLRNLLLCGNATDCPLRK
ncbi:hypothetical protein ILUMI_04286, partial [Ignelater luminosus]